MVDISIDYYKLNESKKMGDGDEISKNQRLILLLKDSSDGTLFLETCESDYKKLFWASENEVEFIENVIENWDEEKINQRNRYINGEFL